MTDPAAREAHFPAIEKKHGKPMAHWHRVMKSIGGLKYADQIAFLRENHRFSQAHANALVMYTKGSTSSRRYSNLDEYLKALDPEKAATITSILDVVTKKFADLETVIAWNQPMLKLGNNYVFGMSAAKNHVLLLPLGNDAIARAGSLLKDLETNKKTIKVPIGWKIDATLLHSLIRMRLDEISVE